MRNDQIAEYLEEEFASSKERALRELRTLVKEAEEAIGNIEKLDGFVSTFPSGGPTFSGEKATTALANLAATRVAVGAVR